MGRVWNFQFVYDICSSNVPVCVWMFFFFFNRQGNLFLYSIHIPIQLHNELALAAFLMFPCFEILSAYSACVIVGSIYFVVSSYFMHSSYWLALNKRNSIWYLQTFQILHLHTSRLNEAVSHLFMLPLKELLGVGCVFCSFSLIRYHNQLDFGSFVMLVFLEAGCVITLFGIYLPAGWVWKKSLTFKNRIGRNDSMEYNKRNSYLCPFGIMIGSFYVVKGHTFLSIVNIVVRYIFRLLVAFK